MTQTKTTSYEVTVFWHAVCLLDIMIRLLIGAYIVFVLVLSAKAGADSKKQADQSSFDFNH